MKWFTYFLLALPPFTSRSLILTSSLPNYVGGRAIIQVNEKEESDAFWGFLGGKGEYPAFSKGCVLAHHHCPVLYIYSNLYFTPLIWGLSTINVDDYSLMTPFCSVMFKSFSERSFESKHEMHRCTHYLCSTDICRSVHPREARLFQGSTATGSFKVEEIAGFDQSDLAVGKYITGRCACLDNHQFGN